MYNLFISHSWCYSDAYQRLLDMLDSREDFQYRNYSVPFDDPVNTNGSDRQLEDAIRRQMAPASCVLVLAGVYATYSKWINKEVEIAIEGFENPKKIIAIEPWGAERTSAFVKDNADIIVKWNTNSIIDAIEDWF